MPLWQQAGWDTSAPVWRLEFEVKQPILSQLDRLYFHQVMCSLGGLWDYATCDWLRLTIPNSEDKTRSRWPVHPLWACLASVDWESPGGALTRTFPKRRTPNNARLMQFGLGIVASHMASQGVSDLEDGLRGFCEGLWKHVEQKASAQGLLPASYLNARVATKMRLYNTAPTASLLGDSERQRMRREADTESYRRASNGG